mmetsp:Transcript_28774/g.54613  ORF Transcript_28774/g.54613 Transcript_28774/m.54613 type:complete len:268 (+) Transcript_28774:1277-2080(+)
MGRLGRFGDLAGDGEHHCNRMFGCGDHIAKGGVHDDHPLFAGRVLVDIVGADACATDNLEVDSVLEDRGCDPCGRADGEAIILADHFGQLVLVLAQIGFEIDLNTPILEDLDGGGGEFVGDEYFGGHCGGPFGCWSIAGCAHAVFGGFAGIFYLGGFAPGLRPPPWYFWSKEDVGSVVLYDFVFDAVMVVEVEPLAGLVIVVFASFETRRTYAGSHSVDIVDHDGDMVEAAGGCVIVLPRIQPACFGHIKREVAVFGAHMHRIADLA